MNETSKADSSFRVDIVAEPSADKVKVSLPFAKLTELVAAKPATLTMTSYCVVVQVTLTVKSLPARLPVFALLKVQT